MTETEGHLQSQQRSPQQCPICGSAALQPNQIAYKGELRIPPSLVSYRCDKGHIFYIDLNEPGASSSK